MRRRDFTAGLGAAAWPLAVRAQQGDRMRRIGVLTPFGESDRDWSPPLRDLGWIDGRNVQIDIRSGGGDVNRMHHNHNCPRIAFCDCRAGTIFYQVCRLRSSTEAILVQYDQSGLQLGSEWTCLLGKAMSGRRVPR